MWSRQWIILWVCESPFHSVRRIAQRVNVFNPLSSSWWIPSLWRHVFVRQSCPPPPLGPVDGSNPYHVVRRLWIWFDGHAIVYTAIYVNSMTRIIASQPLSKSCYYHSDPSDSYHHSSSTYPQSVTQSVSQSVSQPHHSTLHHLLRFIPPLIIPQLHTTTQHLVIRVSPIIQPFITWYHHSGPSDSYHISSSSYHKSAPILHHFDTSIQDHSHSFHHSSSLTFTPPLIIYLSDVSPIIQPFIILFETTIQTHQIHTTSHLITTTQPIFQTWKRPLKLFKFSNHHQNVPPRHGNTKTPSSSITISSLPSFFS